MTASEAPRLRLEAVERYERDVTLRLPFRFGVITVTHATQAVIRATIALPDGRSASGVAAESLGAKWFDKNLAYSDAQNLDQLRQALDIAISLYRARGWSTAFGLYADTYTDQLARGAALDLVPLVASYGPALLDRAILDALGHLHGRSFADMVRHNLPGIAVTGLTPDLSGFDLAAFLAGLRPGATIDVRHTVGLVDPIVAADQKPDERVNDGLPETLEEVVRHYRGRYYKLKVGGDVRADLDRLSRIAAVLDRDAGDYRATLDGNEQYDDVEGIAELWRRMEETPALARLVGSILFIEQPIKRAVALAKPVESLARRKPLIIDESDGELGTFPAALALGYAGVSSKNCKGFYKSILNAARVARLNAAAGSARYFMSAEDLTTLAGVSVQQDLALVSLLGLTHVERNGHHFIDGMSFAPEVEQASFAAAHPDLYERSGGPARLRIDRGTLQLGSLACPGFAVAGDTAFDALRPMPTAPTGRIEPAHAGGKP
ncbi:MAG: mandelate racemase [Alphaproteobacteria bacterium]|nr:mandelate racemase [Alphaproteobacteria bacterium]